MKYLFLLMSFSLIACQDTNHVGDEIDLDIIEVEYENHSYLVFKEPSRVGGGISVIHNINCKCNEND
jgi:hypothetical protein